ncbi:MAG: DNA topoisomerase IB, partial [Thermomicrobiaceae bacterium]|nr:DNA topoisomerase IB [Thermomicrobiaceae bacterium]
MTRGQVAPTGQEPGDGPDSGMPDPAESARSAGLRYVTDRAPGIRRVQTRGGFRYLKPDGSPVEDPREIARIESLAIPPAWTE